MKITKSSEVPWATALQRGPFDQKRKALGGEKLTAGLWELAPGKRSFPLHAHHVTEEALFVLSGHAKVRTPEGETEIGPGDYVSFPPRGPAHQLINHTDQPFTYLGMSSIQGADIVDYPDSGKVALAIGAAGVPGSRRQVFRAKDQADYFEGEE